MSDHTVECRRSLGEWTVRVDGKYVASYGWPKAELRALRLATRLSAALNTKVTIS